MSLEATFRVHIAPQGYEDERIYEPAIENNADRVILLVHTEQTDSGDEFQEAVEQTLTDENIRVETRDCDFFDPEKSVSQIIEVMNEFEKDDIFFNISTGSKITAVTGFMACMVTGTTPYYSKAEDYGDEPVGKNVSETFPLPSLPVDQLETQFIQILKYIWDMNKQEESVIIKDINDFAVKNDLDCVKDADRDEDSDYYDLVRPVIHSLRKRNLIEEQQRGNETPLVITEAGKGAVRMFENTIPELLESDN
jgi:CRISPR locus-related DNA-binding protein